MVPGPLKQILWVVVFCFKEGRLARLSDGTTQPAWPAGLQGFYLGTIYLFFSTLPEGTSQPQEQLLSIQEKSQELSEGQLETWLSRVTQAFPLCFLTSTTSAPTSPLSP